MESTRSSRNPAETRLAFLLPDMNGGGAERVALTIIKDFVSRGYQVDLVLVRAEGPLLALLPPSVTVIDLKAHRLMAALLPLARYFRERKPHAIQIRMWPLTIIGLLAHRLARSKARVVVSDHIALSKQYGHLPITFPVLKASVRTLYGLADERIVVSAGAADDLAAISGVPRDRFKVIYNPAPPLKDVQRQPEIEKLWGDCDGRIITVGTLKTQKNQALLIRSFAILRKHRRAKLMILGQGPLLPKLEEIVAREGLGEDVLFPGFSIQPWDYMASADLFVLSSDYEGFGNVLVEAMRLGLSVVSTDCPSGPSEILGGGEFGRLVPCGDAAALAAAMEEALCHPTDPESLKLQADNLSGQASIDRYLELLLGPAS